MRSAVQKLIWTIALAAVVAPAQASMDVLSDGELVSQASAVFSVKEAPADRILGIYRGNRVIIDVRCSDLCPASTVRIIHYGLPPGPDCAKAGGDEVAIIVPVSIATQRQGFCIPHILYGRKLYTDRPYQR